MNEIPELTGRVALVTGSASGIGRSAAQRLGSLGATLALVDVDEEGLQLVSSELTSAGRSVSVHTADLADLDGVPSIVDAVVECHARVDILVNAAGVYRKGSLLDTSMAAWELVHHVNLAAPFLLMQAVAARLIEQASGGRIVNVSSSSAVRAESETAYACSKAGLLALTRTAAAQLGSHAINVNAVAPGLTATPMAAAAMMGDPSAIERLTEKGRTANLLRRISTPDDVGAVIAFLCTAASRQITGQTIHTSAGAVV